MWGGRGEDLAQAGTIGWNDRAVHSGLCADRLVGAVHGVRGKGKKWGGGSVSVGQVKILD